MKPFKEFLAEPKPRYEWFSFTIEEYHVHMLFEGVADSVLTEAKHKGLPIGGKYSAQLHSAHSAVGQQHVHVYAKNNQLFALNKDGSAHDASRKIQIPNKVAKAIQGKFPWFTLPPDNLIETAPDSVSAAIRSQLLLS